MDIFYKPRQIKFLRDIARNIKYHLVRFVYVLNFFLLPCKSQAELLSVHVGSVFSGLKGNIHSKETEICVCTFYVVMPALHKQRGYLIPLGFSYMTVS
jgi:hypothetical protein